MLEKSFPVGPPTAALGLLGFAFAPVFVAVVAVAPVRDVFGLFGLVGCGCFGLAGCCFGLSDCLLLLALPVPLRKDTWLAESGGSDRDCVSACACDCCDWSSLSSSFSCGFDRVPFGDCGAADDSFTLRVSARAGAEAVAGAGAGDFSPAFGPPFWWWWWWPPCPPCGCGLFPFPWLCV